MEALRAGYKMLEAGGASMILSWCRPAIHSARRPAYFTPSRIAWQTYSCSSQSFGASVKVRVNV